MKTLKIIVAVLLFIALIPATLCVFGDAASFGEIYEDFSNIPIDHLSAEDVVALPSIQDKINSVRFSFSFLTICTFVFVLSAGIFAIAWRKKFYGALTSGILLLVTIGWIISIQNAQKFLVNQKIIIRHITNCTERLTTGTMGLTIVLLFLPMVFLLLTGIIEVIFHFTKKGKNAPAEHTAVPVEKVSQTSTEQNIDDLKKYKDLLDAGIITQEEFDTKKKQLLGL